MKISHHYSVLNFHNYFEPYLCYLKRWKTFIYLFTHFFYFGRIINMTVTTRFHAQISRIPHWVMCEWFQWLRVVVTFCTYIVIDLFKRDKH